MAAHDDDAEDDLAPRDPPVGGRPATPARSPRKATTRRRPIPPPPTPAEKLRGLRRGIRLHAVLATLFVTGAGASLLTPADPGPDRPFDADSILRWEVAVMALGIGLTNLALLVGKRRRLARLEADPDADHPEAEVFG